MSPTATSPDSKSSDSLTSANFVPINDGSSESTFSAENGLGGKVAQEAFPKGVKPSIAIIGAGVAGLKAAEVLLEKGYDVVIYEARDRIGGRICTSNHLGKEVDLGPNWIHGTFNNPIVPLSQLSKSVLHQYSGQCPVYTPDGELMDQAEAYELQGLLWKVIERAVEYSKCCHTAIPVEKSFYDYCVEKAEELFGSNPDTEDDRAQERMGIIDGGGKGGVKRSEEEHIRWKGQEERRKVIWLAMARMWGTFIGSCVTRQSLKFFFLEEPLEGANLFVASTYKSMIKTLSKPSLDAGIVKLDTPIDHITTITADGRKRVSLKSLHKPQENRIVDGVIVTAPLGCLKRDMIKFEPSIPKRIQDSINSLSYGNLEKVYIKFPRAFWGDSGLDFFTFLCPTYAPETNAAGWHMCCFSLAHLPGECAQPTLLFYVFGPTSAHFTETFLPATTELGRSQYIDFFRPYFSKLPGYDEKAAECTPAALVTTEWSREKWAGYGSYSNFQVGLTTGDEDIIALREGIPEQKIWFGGEHTAPILGLGSVSGAYWSGEDAAKKLIGDFEGLGGKSGGVNAAAKRVDHDARNGMKAGMKKANGVTNWYGKTVEIYSDGLEVNGKVKELARNMHLMG